MTVYDDPNARLGVPLTPRECVLLQAIVDTVPRTRGEMCGDAENKALATRLGIARGTVMNHLKHIAAKLGARDRTHAVVLAIRQGAVQL